MRLSENISRFNKWVSFNKRLVKKVLEYIKLEVSKSREYEHLG